MQSETFEAKFDLTPMQQGMLFHTLYAPGRGLYIEQIGYSLQGRLDVPLFEEAWRRVVQRHEILRSSYEWEGTTQAQQRIHREVKLSIDERDWRKHSPQEQQTQLDELMRSDREKGFDLSAAPLMRLILVRLSEEVHHLLWSSHHIQLDGWSQSLILNEVFTIYRSLVSGSPVELPRSCPFADFVTYLKNAESADNEVYWRERLRGFEEPTALGIGGLPGSAGQVDVAHSECEISLSSEATAALQSYARRQRLTPYTLVQGAWALLLSRYSGTNDVVFGSTGSTRPLELEGIESTAGLFINTLPVRVQTPADARLGAWLKGIQLDTLEAREFDYTSLVDVQRWSELAPGQSLFESILVFENYPSDQLSPSVGVNLRVFPAASQLSRTNYPLVLLVMPGDKLRLEIIFDVNRFELDQVERLLGHLKLLLEEMIAASDDQMLSQFSLLGPEERDKLLRSWNDTGCDYDRDACLPQLFERQAAATPDAVAVVFDDSSISYRELNARANRLANHLRTLGVGPEVLVGVCLERSIEMVVGLLGILKVGAAYVPLDPAFPTERLAFMLQDCRASLLLTEQRLLKELPEVDAKIVCIDADSRDITAQSSDNLAPSAASGSLAYVIYTSGSTGKPKGVQIEHRALVNFLMSMAREPGIDERDVLLAVTTLSFDIAGLELYLPLIRGARLVIARRETASDGLLLQARIASCGATVMQATPATWRMLIDAGWNGDPRLKLLCGGESLSRELAIELLPRCGELWNMYGPTETTIWSTIDRIASVSTSSPISIGRPIANTQIYLLDQNSQPVPVGVAGELCIGGDGLARGYLNQPELTAQKFTRNPLINDAEGQRLYRTGDLARYLPDGRIECLGRVDNQVKIRGHRIEVSEIESILAEHPEVRQCVVAARDDLSGGKRLIAYFVGRNETISGTELRAFLKKRLPDYMLPSAFVSLDKLPLTANGKINRRALPAPDLSNAKKESFVAPRTPCEEQLAGIWREVLKLEAVGADDDFFELGGHSLLATQVMSRVLQQFQVQLPLRALFEASTLSALAERILVAQVGHEQSTQPAMKVVSRNGHAPLSFGQQSFWFLTQLNPDSALYNIYRAVRIRGPLQVKALEDSLDAIVQRHEALRTTFVAQQETGVQVIAPRGKANLTQFDLSTLPVNEREPAAARILTEQAQIPFDIGQGPLMRAALVAVSKQEHLFLFAMHHAISDDWSMGVFLNELSALYESFTTGRQLQLPALQLQFADFAIWQRQSLEQEVVAKQLLYWKQQLAGAPRVLELPTDHPRPAVTTYAGAREEIVLPADLMEKLMGLSRREKVTPFMAILAAFQTLLARYTGQQDVVVGSPIAGRSRAETEALIGYFINTLVLRTDLSGDPTFNELLARVRDVALGAYANQEVPFERLVEELQPERTLNHPPIFQVMLIFQNSPAAYKSLEGLSMASEGVSGGLAPLDLTLEMRELPDGMHCWFEYKAELFEASTIAAMAQRFKLLLETVCQDSNQKLSMIQLLTQDEQQQLLMECSRGSDDVDRGQQCIQELFEAQVDRTPAAVAVIHEKEKITYGELNRKANQLANQLREFGVGPETLVGICMERSIEMIVGVLGILKAGGAYVPLDPAYPVERLQLMLSDANPAVLLTQEKLRTSLPTTDAKVICLDSDQGREAEYNAENPKRISTANNLAYVIYTSGSTGKPKGVMVEHASLVNYIENAGLEFGVGHGDRVLQFASLSFDTSAEEIFTCLTRGAKLVLRTEEMLASIEGFLQKCAEWAITIIDLPTAFWHELVRATEIAEQELELPPSLRLVIIGGEAALPEHLGAWQKRFGSEVRLVNTYGPTESTIVATVWEPQVLTNGIDPLREVPIGRPVRNVKTLVLDSFAQPVPTGVTGELHIGGQALARGYLNRPELTAEKFIADPFSQRGNARLYKTGDLARVLPDGNLEYVGRIDNQVKIRGFRVELGEIEAALNEHASVSESAVIVREDSSADKRIVAYFIGTASQMAATADLRSFLSEKLPAFMLPSAFVQLDKLPLTAGGKIDRAALPAPEEMKRPVEGFVAASTTVEKKLAAIWADVLKLQVIGKDDNFFELGGHSLLATQVVSRVRRAFQIELPLRSLFEAPKLSALSLVIEDLEAKLSPARLEQEASIKLAHSRQNLPLSFGQQRLWFIERLSPGESVYNVSRAVRLYGLLNVKALQKALDELVRRHESLRTNFTSVEGAASQLIHATRPIHLNLADLRELPPDEREREASRLLKLEAELSFDLAQDPLLRVTLLRLSGDEHLLLFTLHHIVCDGWSMQVLVEELSALYSASLKGETATLCDLPIQYADFACQQRELFQGEAFDKQIAYWRGQLEGIPAVLALPADRARPRVQTFHGARQTLSLSQEVTAQLKSLSQAQSVTLFMTLLAAWQALLHRYSGETDIVIGSPIAGRNYTETENLIGLFVNALALRTDLSGDPTFSELLERVREVALGAYAHQDLPFEKLVEELQPQRNLSYNPVFQVVFALQNGSGADLQLDGLRTTPAEIQTTTAKFDLTLDVIEKNDALLCSLEYNTDLFESDRMVRMLGHFEMLLTALVSDPAQRISAPLFLTETERQQLLVEWNNTQSDYPRHKSVHQLFESQAAQTPNATAVVLGDEKLSYLELNRRSNQLALYLRRQGIGPESLVGICMDRSLELVIGLLGILKAGAAYVPLDAEYPRSRLSFMLEDASVSLVLTQQRTVGSLPENSPTICLDSEWEMIAAESEQNLACEVTADNLAYVMYTSGSTGEPKGVAVVHRNIVRLVKETNYASFGSDEVFLQLAPVSFDASTFEIWGALLNGASLVMMSPGTPSLDELGETIDQYRVTTLWLTAGLFQLMVDTHLEDLRGLRQLLAGGDVLSVAHVKRFLDEAPNCRLINGYGPTEGTTFTCCHPISQGSQIGESIPIGRPIANTQVYILGQGLQPVPVGVTGVLYIGGDGLARGYFKRPELTRERFIANPFVNDPQARLYKTGDLARYLADGTIEFLGRCDQQIKIRGFRIEPGEIETALNQHPGIRECVVTAREDTPGDKRLVAYVVALGNSEIRLSELRDHLKQTLPDHMLPSTLVFLKELPLSPNGKVERAALPSPGNERPELDRGFVGPRDEVETRLAQIWEATLNVRPIGVRDNFFDLGGHSLLAVRLFAQIEKLFNRQLPLAILFQAPTIEGLATVLREEPASRSSSLVAIQPGGPKPPFFCVHAVGGNVLEYHELARHLGPDQPFYALQSQGLDGKRAPLTRIDEMASVYLEEMRAVQPHGPYLIGGRSFGGLVAFEMACQLQAEGEEVSLLALLDTYPIGHYKLLPSDDKRNASSYRLAKRFESHSRNLKQLRFRRKLEYLWNKLRYVPAKTKGQVWASVFKLYGEGARPIPRLLRNIEQINFSAARNYLPQVYPGKVTLFLASADMTAAYDLREGWEALAQGVEVHEIEGDHINIIKEPFVGQLAAELNACLEQASSAGDDKTSSPNLEIAA